MSQAYNPGPGFSESSPMGWRHRQSISRREFHAGVDFRAALGTPIRAAAAGEVWYVGKNTRYGNTVILRHLNDRGETFYTLYAHMNGQQMPALRSVLNGGDVIGQVGSSGKSEGPHLHFEIIRHDPRRRIANTAGGPIGISSEHDGDLREDPRTFRDWPTSRTNITPPAPLTPQSQPTPQPPRRPAIPDPAEQRSAAPPQEPADPWGSLRERAPRPIPLPPRRPEIRGQYRPPYVLADLPFHDYPHPPTPPDLPPSSEELAWARAVLAEPPTVPDSPSLSGPDEDEDERRLRSSRTIAGGYGSEEE